MGAWNCSINGNDTAQDLIYEYRAVFYYNDVDTAVRKIYDYVTGYIWDDEMPDFIYSLADFMWRKGILTDEIKNKAIEMMDSDYGMEVWKESGEKIYNKRKKILNDFKQKLLSPQPLKKKISLKMNIQPIFNEGDIITFKIETKNLDCSQYINFDLKNLQYFDNKYVVLRKAYDHISYTSSIEPNVKDTWAVFQIIPKFFDSEPSIEEINKYLNYELECKDMILTESNLYYFKKRNYTLLGNVKPKFIKGYEHSFNGVESVYFSINQPWSRPEVEIIKKIIKLNQDINKHINSEKLDTFLDNYFS